MNKARLAPLLILAVVALPAIGADTLPGPIVGQVLSITDGDTVRVKAKVWLGLEIETLVRLEGIDTPELKGRCDDERRRAEAARAFLEHLLPEGRVILREVVWGKYAGRVVARVETPKGEDVATAMIRAGHARPYNGGHRQPWCE
ncbi:MAG: thermonuclease family protein [Alphaproteobacteria bacterium]|nr:thermonuclease family protein [Alphaproteobacteria bacterium]